MCAGAATRPEPAARPNGAWSPPRCAVPSAPPPIPSRRTTQNSPAGSPPPTRTWAAGRNPSPVCALAEGAAVGAGVALVPDPPCPPSEGLSSGFGVGVGVVGSGLGVGFGLHRHFLQYFSKKQHCFQQFILKKSSFSTLLPALPEIPSCGRAHLRAKQKACSGVWEQAFFCKRYSAEGAGRIRRRTD